MPAGAAALSASRDCSLGPPGSVASPRTLTLPDTDPSALSLVLEYAYTGDLRPCAAAGVGGCLGAVALAARLGVGELQACGEELAVALLQEDAGEAEGSAIGEEERVALAAFAELHGLRRLRDLCTSRRVRLGVQAAQ